MSQASRIDALRSRQVRRVLGLPAKLAIVPKAHIRRCYVLTVILRRFSSLILYIVTARIDPGGSYTRIVEYQISRLRLAKALRLSGFPAFRLS
jgi:hypothetical protein